MADTGGWRETDFRYLLLPQNPPPTPHTVFLELQSLLATQKNSLEETDADDEDEDDDEDVAVPGFRSLSHETQFGFTPLTTVSQENPKFFGSMDGFSASVGHPHPPEGSEDGKRKTAWLPDTIRMSTLLLHPPEGTPDLPSLPSNEEEEDLLQPPPPPQRQEEEKQSTGQSQKTSFNLRMTPSPPTPPNIPGLPKIDSRDNLQAVLKRLMTGKKGSKASPVTLEEEEEEEDDGVLETPASETMSLLGKSDPDATSSSGRQDRAQSSGAASKITGRVGKPRVHPAETIPSKDTDLENAVILKHSQQFPKIQASSSPTHLKSLKDGDDNDADEDGRGDAEEDDDDPHFVVSETPKDKVPAREDEGDNASMHLSAGGQKTTLPSPLQPEENKASVSSKAAIKNSIQTIRHTPLSVFQLSFSDSLEGEPKHHSETQGDEPQDRIPKTVFLRNEGDTVVLDGSLPLSMFSRLWMYHAPTLIVPLIFPFIVSQSSPPPPGAISDLCIHLLRWI